MCHELKDTHAVVNCITVYPINWIPGYPINSNTTDKLDIAIGIFIHARVWQFPTSIHIGILYSVKLSSVGILFTLSIKRRFKSLNQTVILFFLTVIDTAHLNSFYSGRLKLRKW